MELNYVCKVGFMKLVPLSKIKQLNLIGVWYPATEPQENKACCDLEICVTSKVCFFVVCFVLFFVRVTLGIFRTVFTTLPGIGSILKNYYEKLSPKYGGLERVLFKF